MDLIKEISELKETIGHEIMEANQQIKKSGGDLNTADIDMIDKLAHSMKSLVGTCIMLEGEEGYSNDYMNMPYYGGGYSSRRGYSREGRENRNGGGYSGNYGSYSQREGRGYSREGRNSYGYSRTGDWSDQLRMMMDDAPDEGTRMEIKKLIDRMDNQR